MRLVLDACVAIAATRPAEPSHATSKARIQRALCGDDELVLPSFFLVETSGALARIGHPHTDIVTLVDALGAPPHKIVTIGRKRHGPPET
jgi:predicted nucleic acid-binding protein